MPLPALLVATLLGLDVASAQDADVEMVSIGVPSPIEVGVPQTYRITVRNNGPDTTNALAAFVKASDDTTLDYVDDPTVCSARGLAPLNNRASATYEFTCTWTLPATPVYVIIYAYDEVRGFGRDSDIANNRKRTSSRVTPSAPCTRDVAISAFSASASAPPGADVGGSATLANSGSCAADNVLTRLLLSTDAAVDAGDAVLCEGRPTVPAGGSTTLSPTCPIPAAHPTGAYQLLVVADADGAVAETDEGNNVVARPIQVVPAPPKKADLRPDSVNAPGAVLAGAPFTVTYQLSNEGDGAAGSAVTRVLLSVDAAVDGGDVSVCEERLASVAVGATRV